MEMSLSGASMKNVSRTLGAVLLLVSPFLGLSCQSVQGAKPVQKVILISIDTLRPDYLGCYNNRMETSPNIDEFASENVLFTNATSHAPSTAISHKSILYSLYPAVHQSSTNSVPEEKIKSPIETLRLNGFKTAAFVGGGQLSRKFGFARGFDTYQEGGKYNPSDSRESLETLETSVNAWLDRNSQDKFFLFLHTYQVHCPYYPPVDYRNRAAWYTGRINPREACGDNYYNLRKLSSTDIRYIRDLYAGEVQYVDDFIGRLLEGLKDRDIYEETLIVFFSDHGESLGERGYIGHNLLYSTHLSIPLILKIPGVSGTRVDHPVEGIDIMPTVFSVLNLKRPYRFQGRDLLPIVTRKALVKRSRIQIAEQSGRVRIKKGKMVAIFSPRGGQPEEVYDVEKDPAERTNLIRTQHLFLAECKREYSNLIKSSRDLASMFVIPESGAPALDEQTKEQLKSLGYAVR
jgi:arylsulfatase A-like enzyme